MDGFELEQPTAVPPSDSEIRLCIKHVMDKSDDKRKGFRYFTEQHRKNTVANLSRHLVSCSLQAGVKICVKVDRTSMMKSREYDETKKSGGLLRKNRSCTYFKASSFACNSCFESVFGFGRGKARLKYRPGHRSLWNVTTWRLSGEAGIFFPGWLRKQTHGSGPCLQTSFCLISSF